MANFMKPFEEQTYAALRILSGFAFLWHGTQKLFAFPQAMPFEAPAFVVYVAGPLELVGGLLLMAGFLTRWTAFVCSGLMAAAYWMAHGTKHLIPMMNGGELAYLYCFLFLFIAARGPGIWSVDGASK